MADFRSLFLYEVPPSVMCDFCWIMDSVSDLDWTRFASHVLSDQTTLRLAERMKRRTDWVMVQWGNRKGRVGDLIDLLERLQLLHPRDVILCWASTPPPPPLPPAAPPAAPPPPISRFDPPPKPAPPTESTCELIAPGFSGDEGGGRPLPRPAPPPPSLQSHLQPPPPVAPCCSGVMKWSYDEVHAGTQGFSPALQVGEGGFGVVYKATLSNIDCAVKRLKQDCSLDWTQLRKSFQTEVDQLSKFRHPNIVELLGVSDGGPSVCLIYSFMDKRSLEDQLHDECVVLSWSQRVSVVKEASTALQFLHFPPDGHKPLVHGDVKSSNILLDRHMVAKLADFGLARCVSSGRSAARTAPVGKTSTIRGTLAYLPDEYVRNGELGTAVDVYSFGVVLLEVLTGRRALERDRKSGERFLKDLVDEVEDSPAAWSEQLDRRLTSGGAAEPAQCMEVVSLACRCLKRRRRPDMMEVFGRLQDILTTMRETSSSPSRPPHPQDSSVGALSHQLSTLGPLEDTYRSSKSWSECSLAPPDPLHSSSSLPPSHSSLAGPCETDESRGFSQYDAQSNGTSCRSLSQSTRDQYHSLTGPAHPPSSQPSVPTEDQYNFHPESSSTRSLSPVRSLQSFSLEPSVLMNPGKLKTTYEEGRIQTPELLSTHDLYGGRSCEEFREPEESDELDYCPDPDPLTRELVLTGSSLTSQLGRGRTEAN